ncbi:MAG: membrane protein insertion efficiency factor YidD [Pseudomonadota bacterium]
MLANVALLGIYGYQRWLSPRKGYRCAYSVVHGGTGCSGYAKYAIRDHGLFRALPLIRARFADCKAAAVAFAAKREDDGQEQRKKRENRREACCCAAEGAFYTPSACAGAGARSGSGKILDLNPCDGDIGCGSCDACSIDVCPCS